MAIFAGIEAALIITIRPIYNDGKESPVMIIGIIAAVFLALGLLPPYWEIYKRHGRVLGISWLFLATDFAGGFFSLMSLIAQNTLDIVALAQYCVVLGLELGLFLAGVVDWVRHRKDPKGDEESTVVTEGSVGEKKSFETLAEKDVVDEKV